MTRVTRDNSDVDLAGDDDQRIIGVVCLFLLF